MIVLGNREKISAHDRQLVVALGNFDGVHRGHQLLLQRMTTYAHNNSALSSVFLFHPHPQQVLNPKGSPKLLLDTNTKIELLKQQGAEVIFIVPFNLKYASLAPEDFVEKILVGELRVSGVFVGYDYRFGCGAQGTPELLKELGEQKGFQVEVIPPVIYQGLPISSTLVRKALLAGDILQAKDLLGYWPTLKGEIIAGDQRGRKLGFPTANVKLPDDLLIPQNGVYAGEALVEGERYLTVINIGVHPTFGSSPLQLIEAHLLDFQGVVYHKNIEIKLIKKLREERKFQSSQDLINQIRKDIETAGKIYEDLGCKELYKASSGLNRKIYNEDKLW
ncbi:MAG: bifunctional riboflavin kinase/FAD synthetase [Syntrophaceticus sp.]